MKNYKKLFISALAMLLAGAGFGAFSALNADAADGLVFNDIAAGDVTSATLKTIVASKIKQCDQATLDNGSNGNANGYFTKEGGTPRYVTADKDGETVNAAYDYNTIVAIDKEEHATYASYKLNVSKSLLYVYANGEHIGDKNLTSILKDDPKTYKDANTASTGLASELIDNLGVYVARFQIDSKATTAGNHYHTAGFFYGQLSLYRQRPHLLHRYRYHIFGKSGYGR